MAWIDKETTTVRIPLSLLKKVYKLEGQYDIHTMTVIRVLLNYFVSLAISSQKSIINAYIDDLQPFKLLNTDKEQKDYLMLKRLSIYKVDDTFNKMKVAILKLAAEINTKINLTNLCIILLLFFIDLEEKDRDKFFNRHYKKDKGFYYLQKIKEIKLA